MEMNTELILAARSLMMICVMTASGLLLAEHSLQTILPRSLIRMWKKSPPPERSNVQPQSPQAVGKFLEIDMTKFEP